MVEDAIAFLADGFHMLLHNFIYTQNWLLNLLKYIFLFNVKIKVLFCMTAFFHQDQDLSTLLWSSKSSVSSDSCMFFM